MAPNFSENKWVNQLINLSTSLIIVLVTVYLTTSDLDARELKKNIEEKMSEADFNLRIDPIKDDIKELKEKDREIQQLFLDELRLLRQELKLKVDKN